MDTNITKKKNTNLHSAKATKNDEFYTQLEDIELELKYYKKHFEGKIVYCNCDNPEWSNFYKFFENYFRVFGLKKLITTHYTEGSNSYKLELNGFNETPIKTPLNGDGDFRSEECKEIMKEVDIVVTNPPFSLFRKYIAQLIKYDKKFLIIGSDNALTYKEIFPLIKNNLMWKGFSRPQTFKTKEDIFQKFGNISWYTNLTHFKRVEELYLIEEYDENSYQKYDNFDAINVDAIRDIPKDYDGCIGVPITFLDNHNPEQFEILGSMASTTIDENSFGYPFINGNKKYARIIIKKIKKDN
ncbi:MAG: adenine-specific methyltransferase EcoRI family protein [Mycoplasma sp.]